MLSRWVYYFGALFDGPQRFGHNAEPFFMAKIIMKFPNLRYGNPAEFDYYSLGIPDADLARQLRRSEETVKAWRNGTQKIPFWVPELLRLRRMEHHNRLRQMGISKIPALASIGASGELVQFKPRYVAPPEVEIADDKIAPLEQIRA